MNKVLVLNTDFTPINVTSLFRGFNLVNNGKAEIVKSADEPIRTEYNSFARPLIIRLLKYVKYRVYKLKINRSRLFKRDNFQCVYCGSKKNLTIDHIIPKSRGGDNSWTNLTTSCFQCNKNKGNRTPEEANMILLNKPYEPTIFSEIINSNVENIWKDFQRTMGM